MDAIGTHLGREGHVVVNHKGDAGIGAHGLELAGKRERLVMPGVLLAKLDEGRTARHGVAHAVGK